MLTKIKAFTKEPIFWILTAIGAILIFSVISVILLLPKPTPQPPAETVPDPTQAPTQSTQPTTPTTPPVKGIDVSEHQTQIDWQQVKAAGMEFVMIRVGWRGETKGQLFADTLAQTHYAGAKAAGLKVGAYIFSQANTPEEGKEDAEFLLEQTKDWKIDMHLVFNWEHLSDLNRTATVDAKALTAITQTFCQTVAQGGQNPMVYFDAYLASTRMYLQELREYPFWLAQYAEQMEFRHPVKMWQYTCTGTVPGIDGNVDINYFYP